MESHSWRDTNLQWTQFQQCPYDSFRRVPVPKVRYPAHYLRILQYLFECRKDTFRTSPDERIGPDLDRDGALGVLAQGDAGDAEDAGLLLDTAGVAEDEARVGHEAHEVEVAYGLNEPDARRGGEAGAEVERVDALARARVDGEDDGHAPLDRLQRGEDALERAGVVHAGGPVEGEDGVVGSVQAEAAVDVGLGCEFPEAQEGVDHDVADVEDVLLRDALVAEVLQPGGLADEEVIGDVVGEESVDLFGHRSIKAAQPGLDVRYLHPQLRLPPERMPASS